MILVDSNVPMYLVGASHPHKADAQRVLAQLIGESERLITDAEVLQEILRRFVSIQRREAVQPAFDALLGVVDEVLPITRRDVERARTIVLGSPRLSARDAIHVAVMQHCGAERILSFDRGFDAVPGVARVH